jgi:hypothetical protein
MPPIVVDVTAVARIGLRAVVDGAHRRPKRHHEEPHQVEPCESCLRKLHSVCQPHSARRMTHGARRRGDFAHVVDEHDATLYEKPTLIDYFHR